MMNDALLLEMVFSGFPS